MKKPILSAFQFNRFRFFAIFLFALIIHIFLSNQRNLQARPAWHLWGTVTRVADGDTVVARIERAQQKSLWPRICRHKSKKGPCQVRVRLVDIDAPEWGRSYGSRQPFGKKSREFLKKLVLGQRAHFVVQQRDRYRRLLAVLYVKGQDINKYMVCQGMASVYRYSRNKDYKKCQRSAKRRSIGVWSLGRDYIDPYIFRKKRKKHRAR